ncbi:hypothetical protein [Luteolibacter sp. Populi]|uniref:hypothetical protein n=1 Tax=Luteolibacter sp. Populi TaxID=3230487 RepID=UPI0034669DC1
MSRRSIRLSLLLAASVRLLAAQEPPVPAIPAEDPPPAAVPVDEEPPPAAIPVDEGPVIVAPGGNLPQPAAEERAISLSGMFRVYGGDAKQRGSVVLLLEQTKNAFEGLLRETELKPDEDKKEDTFRVGPKNQLEPFKIPVDVVLSAEPLSRNVIYQVIVTPNAYFLRIRIHLARGIDHELLERAALNMLLYERALRNMKPEEDDENPIPVVRPWLVEGLVEAERWRTNRADRRIYEGVFRQGGGFTPDEIFELPDSNFRRLDGASKLSFRALSGALVMALLEQPDGRGAFRSFCGEAALFSGEMPVLLRKHFPQLNLSANSLAKWWALKLAQIIQPPLTEVISVPNTELALDDALQFHIRDANDNPMTRGLDGWQELAALKEPERVEATRHADEALIRLSYRCFPSYRALLSEYQGVLRDLVAGKSGAKIAKQLEELAAQRKIRVERSRRAEDYLNFIEISQARELSGEFDDYVRLKEELELRPRPQRHDRVTGTLDVMNKAYDLEKSRDSRNKR